MFRNIESRRRLLLSYQPSLKKRRVAIMFSALEQRPPRRLKRQESVRRRTLPVYWPCGLGARPWLVCAFHVFYVSKNASYSSFVDLGVSF